MAQQYFTYTLEWATDGIQKEVQEPAGWDGMTLNIKRDSKVDGVFYNFGTDFLFHCDGYEILKNAYQTEGIFAIARCYISIVCDGRATALFQGRVDMNTIEFSEFPQQVKCNIEQDDAVMTFKNRADTPIDLFTCVDLNLQPIPCDTSTPALPYSNYELTLHGQTIQKLAIFSLCPPDPIVNGDQCSFAAPYPIAGNPLSMRAYSVVDPLGAQGFLGSFCDCGINEIPGAGLGDDTFGEELTITALVVPQPCNEGDITIPLTLCLNVEICFPPSNTFQVDFWLRDLAATNLAHLLSFSFTNSDPAYNCQTYTINTSVNVPIALAGQVLRFKFDITATSQPCDPPLAPIVNISATGTAIWTCLTTFPDTQCQVALAYEAFEKIKNVIDEGELAFSSTYYGRTDRGYEVDGCAAFKAITNGFLIRQFPYGDGGGTPPEPCSCEAFISDVQKDRRLFLSFNELFQAMDSLDNLGWGIEDRNGVQTLVVERKTYFYQYTDPYQLFDVTNYKTKPLTERIFNGVEIGFEKADLELGTQNGLDEFNTKRTLNLTVNRTNTNTLSKICKFVGSGYAIEATRRLPFSTDSQHDFKYDNDKFVICVKHTDLTQSEQNERFSSVTGIIDPATAFNLSISPMRNLTRFYDVLAAPVPSTNTGLAAYKWTKGTSNYTLETVLDTGYDCCEGVDVKENNDFNPLTFIADSGCEGTYKAELIEVSNYQLSFSDYIFLKANPYTLIQVNVQGRQAVLGWIWEIKYHVAKFTADFVLIAAQINYID